LQIVKHFTELKYVQYFSSYAEIGLDNLYKFLEKSNDHK
jgi:hypothetical protein